MRKNCEIFEGTLKKAEFHSVHIRHLRAGCLGDLLEWQARRMILPVKF